MSRITWTRRDFLKTSCMLSAGTAVSMLAPGWIWAARMAEAEILKQHYYAGIRGLAEYPYFELTDNGLLRLTVDGLEGGIDGHTHLNLNSLAGSSIDLLQHRPKTQYYLPPDIRSSLHVYANQNAGPEAKKRMTNTIINSLLPWGSEVTDTHTIPNLLAEMDLLGIEKAVVFPVCFGWPFGDDMTERYAEAITASGREDRFILCASVQPTNNEAAEAVEKYQAGGYRGIKLHPNFARFYPNDKAAWPVYETCGKLGLPVLLHSGRTGFVERKTLGMKIYTEDYADIANFEEPIAAFPDTRFVLCHAGALQNEQAIRLARQYKNVWLDIHGQGVDRIQAMIGEIGAERLMYGSDWAFYPEAVILIRLLVATENDHTVRKMIFSDNARRFWGLAS